MFHACFIFLVHILFNKSIIESINEAYMERSKDNAILLCWHGISLDCVPLQRGYINIHVLQLPR